MAWLQGDEFVIAEISAGSSKKYLLILKEFSMFSYILSGHVLFMFNLFEQQL